VVNYGAPNTKIFSSACKRNGPNEGRLTQKKLEQRYLKKKNNNHFGKAKNKR